MIKEWTPNEWRKVRSKLQDTLLKLPGWEYMRLKKVKETGKIVVTRGPLNVSFDETKNEDERMEIWASAATYATIPMTLKDIHEVYQIFLDWFDWAKENTTVTTTYRKMKRRKPKNDDRKDKDSE